MKSFSIAALALASLWQFSCNISANKTPAPAVYLDTVGMDRTVSPADNFFAYANGNWIKTIKIPDDQSGWGTFYVIYEDNQKKLKTILEKAANAKAAKGSLEQKVGDYYAAGMDTVSIEKKGAEPLRPILAKIDAIKDHKEMMAFVADAYMRGEGELLGFYVGSDDMNSSRHIAVFSQSGCSLPEKEYYTRTDSNSVAIRNAFTKFIRGMFTLSGTDSASAAAQATAILALETEISASHRSPVELRDPQKNYNKLSVAELDKQMPNIGWANFVSKLNTTVDSVNVGQPAYFAALNKMIAAKPIELWKTKLKFEYISGNAVLLSKDFRDAHFEYNKVFTGAKTQTVRWKKIVNAVDADLPELVGQLYVKDHFNAAAKKRMDEMVTNLQKAFETRINALDWMGDSTKTRARAKLHAFLKKIGNPDKWKTYEDVNIDRADYFSSAKSIMAYGQKEMLGKINKPVDRTEWGMSAPTVNAYYNPSNNEIVFPAGILQQPFFALGADDAINYGAIGMVIGHEMTHGFDDQGSQYDDAGNLKNWWTAEDGKRFKAKTKVVVDQYSAFKVLDSLHLNGELTQGENIADIGGLAIAYDAFKMTKQGKGNQKIDGFTPDQRFFLGFAQSWRERMREETSRMLVNVDPHSPAIYRVNGPLSNFTPFYTAFGIKETDKMYIKPESRAKIW